MICCYFLSRSKWWESFSRDSLENDSSWVNLTRRTKYHGSDGLVPNFPTGFTVRLWPLLYYKSGSNFLCLYSRSFDILPMLVCTIKGFIISCQRDNCKFWIPIKSVIECPTPQENHGGDGSQCILHLCAAMREFGTETQLGSGQKRWKHPRQEHFILVD